MSFYPQPALKPSVSGSSVIARGVERYVRALDGYEAHGVRKQRTISDRALYVSRVLYRLRPSPLHSDIISINLDSDNVLSVDIARGHYILLDFFKVHVFHGSFSIEATLNGIEVRCACGVDISLDPRSIR